eukprot:gene12613-15841_t
MGCCESKEGAVNEPAKDVDNEAFAPEPAPVTQPAAPEEKAEAPAETAQSKAAPAPEATSDDAAAAAEVPASAAVVLPVSVEAEKPAPVPANSPVDETIAETVASAAAASEAAKDFSAATPEPIAAPYAVPPAPANLPVEEMPGQSAAAIAPELPSDAVKAAEGAYAFSASAPDIVAGKHVVDAVSAPAVKTIIGDHLNAVAADPSVADSATAAVAVGSTAAAAAKPATDRSKSVGELAVPDAVAGADAEGGIPAASDPSGIDPAVHGAAAAVASGAAGAAPYEAGAKSVAVDPSVHDAVTAAVAAVTLGAPDASDKVMSVDPAVRDAVASAFAGVTSGTPDASDKVMSVDPAVHDSVARAVAGVIHGDIAADESMSTDAAVRAAVASAVAGVIHGDNAAVKSMSIDPAVHDAVASAVASVIHGDDAAVASAVAGAVVGLGAAATAIGSAVATVIFSGDVDQNRSTTTSAAGGVSAYESSKAVDEYLAFHYGDDKDILSYYMGPMEALHFTARCAMLCEKHCAAVIDPTANKGPTTALDLGCAVGGASFELARAFGQVQGLDFSASFVEAAQSMKAIGSREYTAVVEAEITTTGMATVAEDVDRERVTFMQGDACNLPADLPSFDAVLAANLLCRLPEPTKFLESMSNVGSPNTRPRIVDQNPGPKRVARTPDPKREARTPTPNSGAEPPPRSGAPIKTADNVKAILSKDFVLVAEENLPFLIRQVISPQQQEHSRKYQWGCSAATVWKRKEEGASEVAVGAIVSPDDIAMSIPTEEARSTTSAAGGGVSAYETAKAVDEYLGFHYGADKDILPYLNGPIEALHFPACCAALCEKFSVAVSDPTVSEGPTTALDIGCAVGGASFNLARAFGKVQGIDFSHAFVAAAQSMKEASSRDYIAMVEGEITETFTATVPDDVDKERVSFMQGDACNLPADLPSFDAVLAANLLCRLPEPTKFLHSMSNVVKPGGVLVLVSPHSWLEAWTPKSKWLGGFVQGGEAMKTFDGIKAVLSNDFELISQQDMPFLIREHSRKYQWGCSDATVWRRKV